MAVVILFPFTGEALVLVCWGTLLDELCWGALHVQALVKTVSRLAFVHPLGLRQHGSLQTQAGQLLQRHAGGEEKKLIRCVRVENVGEVSLKVSVVC